MSASGCGSDRLTLLDGFHTEDNDHVITMKNKTQTMCSRGKCSLYVFTLSLSTDLYNCNQTTSSHISSQ